MTEQPKQGGGGRRSIGGIAPKLAELTDDVLFEDVWNRPGLPARDRSLITVAALIAGGDAEQLRFHLGRAKENGVTETELVEAITHLAFYAGWPKAMTPANAAKQVFEAWASPPVEPPRWAPPRLGGPVFHWWCGSSQQGRS